MTRPPLPLNRPPGLVDQFGRVARDLRVSVTDRCNLRCTYCMPAEGLPWMPKAEMLTDEEMLRVIGVFVRDGVTQVRLTGGEPLLRRSIVQLVAGIAALEPRPRIAMTTNGVGLARVAQGLADAGLDRVNVSLDTIDAETFTQLTRRDRLSDVEAGLKAAADAGLTPVKVNAVAMRGINDETVADVLDWCLDRGYELRFIEQMPLDAQHAWDRRDMITADEIRARLSERHTLTPLPAEARGSAPAERFLVDGGPATVGIIASVTAPFCAACDRTRLTADGQVRNCLFSRTETDLRTPLRDGATDDELLDLIRGEMWRKRRGHGIGDPDFVQPDRPMSAIGG
ncbi:molybdenum cofactor biosynthesis protein MoeA [Intrasporangium chromatireducens Q5-1]|uniref:GTP 3',8-cyclase n=1 Tax=Intrasporangium chromatireducens Q5-1 TaxID=584657 RepID=W9GRU9_9MICO|nr:GTP 3',8-cyclase MoaA [Intrasporangium chromatireducens]EWT06599.1 molybdenum cofactor biosynthesis protein MoeA [Intrasporangium chromatireducens Q5-1]